MMMALVIVMCVMMIATARNRTCEHVSKSITAKSNVDNLLSPQKRRNVFTGVRLSVCLTVTTITKKIVDGFVPNFSGRFLGGKGRSSYSMLSKMNLF